MGAREKGKGCRRGEGGLKQGYGGDGGFVI